LLLFFLWIVFIHAFICLVHWWMGFLHFTCQLYKAQHKKGKREIGDHHKKTSKILNKSHLNIYTYFKWLQTYMGTMNIFKDKKQNFIVQHQQNITDSPRGPSGMKFPTIKLNPLISFWPFDIYISG
jgi:hypothetical protein